MEQIARQEIIERAKNIKLVILDVDGVLTNGELFFFNNGECKAFNARDGLGIAMLLREHIDLAIISGNHSEAVTARMKKFGIIHIYQGVEDKSAVYQSIKDNLSVRDEEVAYMGDDLIDLPVMKQVGLPTSVADGDAFVLEQALWVSQFGGGRGAVRELCELILKAKGKLDVIRAEYIK